MAFTHKQLKNLPARDKPYREWEGGHNGFGVQVTPKGAKTFFYFYRFNGRRRFMNLGRFDASTGSTSLSDARKRLREAQSLFDSGIDPQDHLQEQQAQKEQERLQREREARRGSIQQLFDLYVEDLQRRGKRSYADVKGSLYRNSLAVLSPTMLARDVTPEDIVKVMSKVIDRGALVQANRNRGYMQAAFNYGRRFDLTPDALKTGIRFDIIANPVEPVPTQHHAEQVGNRELSPEEIKYYWTHIGDRLEKPTTVALKLLLALGGARVGEVIGATWEEFDLKRAVWELPANRSKNGRPHVIPLGSLAVELIHQLTPFRHASPYLFPKRNQDDGPMTIHAFAQAVDRFCKRTEFKKFTPRDLRRTCKTRMGEAGISKDIRDRLHNHALHDVSSKHYDRYDYMTEKREAIEIWNAYLSEIIS